MAREMTPQERAAATRLCIDLLSIIHSDPHPIDEPCGQCLAAIRLYAQGTRRAALLEAREVVLAEVLEDIPDNEADEAYNLAIGHAAHALDRLAQEG